MIAKKEWDSIYNDDKQSSIKWRENSKKIEQTMNLLSTDCKKIITSYYDKNKKV